MEPELKWLPSTRRPRQSFSIRSIFVPRGRQCPGSLPDSVRFCYGGLRVSHAKLLRISTLRAQHSVWCQPVTTSARPSPRRLQIPIMAVASQWKRCASSMHKPLSTLPSNDDAGNPCARSIWMQRQRCVVRASGPDRRDVFIFTLSKAVHCRRWRWAARS
jgi:hypothetical protein